MPKWIKTVGLLLGIVVVIFAIRSLGLEQHLVTFREWVAAQGHWGPIIFIFAYALGTIVAFPGSALSIMAGILFGSVVGVIVVISGATLGAAACFLIARYLLRSSVETWLLKSEKFQKLDDITEKNGSIIVAITRLVPLFPFNMLNYGFGLTKVPFLTYVLWTFICIIPGTALYVVGTDAITYSISQGEVPWLLVGIIVLILGILTVIVRKAKKSLQE